MFFPICAFIFILCSRIHASQILTQKIECLIKKSQEELLKCYQLKSPSFKHSLSLVLSLRQSLIKSLIELLPQKQNFRKCITNSQLLGFNIYFVQ